MWCYIWTISPVRCFGRTRISFGTGTVPWAPFFCLLLISPPLHCTSSFYPPLLFPSPSPSPSFLPSLLSLLSSLISSFSFLSSLIFLIPSLSFLLFPFFFSFPHSFLLFPFFSSFPHSFLLFPFFSFPPSLPPSLTILPPLSFLLFPSFPPSFPPYSSSSFPSFRSFLCVLYLSITGLNLFSSVVLLLTGFS